MIPFNLPSITKLEEKYIIDALSSQLCGDGKYTKKATILLSRILQANNLLLTTSCSHALELAALTLPLQKDEEVILPSFTFVSTANAFLLRGLKPVFCEIEPETFNMDTTKIENCMSEKTRAIVPVHYAGVSCNMDKVNEIAKKYGLFVIEDAAQALGSKYKGRTCGTLSDIGCFSFHETKNIVMGEGGAAVFSNSELRKRAEILREKGTNRTQFFRGEVDKYTWHMIGSSYLPSDILTAILTAQLERFDEIQNRRMQCWKIYYDSFEQLEDGGYLKRPYIPPYAEHNAHIFYLVLNTENERDRMLQYLKQNEIQAVFHYIPLHSAPMGLQMGYCASDLPVTEAFAQRMIRLPLWADISHEQIETVIQKVYNFFMKRES